MKYPSDKLAAINADPNLPKLDDEPIKAVLAEATPSLSLTKHGRMRLVSALAYKYGENFRNFQPAVKALKHFDDSHALMRHYLRLKGHVRG